MRQLWMEDVTPHYPLTLAAWRERFLAAWERLAKLGFDERFKRLWLFYLGSSEAGFRERRLGDIQALYAKPAWRGDDLDSGSAARATAAAAPRLASALS
jgi:hypothetical protein